ncbi:RNA polymerase sigma factor [Novosphingobium sp. G106]|uniref:RNA polymerase sigma factor n=1 Tax=Novosphingobium sp. G106 TaxID=2849500 RepID=UPI001C2CD7C3|nr:RNA polymerase sigma factor [Novosphingobium sp. G106]MBV1687737.1 RNA polymerase sigma factor [Novosphingobium sp. G106]
MEARQLFAPPEEAKDDTLMQRVAQRDGAAFKVLVGRHAARPHRIAWRMLGDGAEAEDVTQEALMRLWKVAPDWRAQGAPVSAWLARVATNICLDRLRRKARISDEAVPERADEAPLADEALLIDEKRQAVIGALGLLPERQRAAVVLTYYEEMSNASAAEMLGMNVRAFESLLARARRALQSLLVENGNG